MVELLLAVMAVTAEPSPFADVRPLEIGACGQDDVGKFGVALEPDRLADDELEIRRLEHLHVAVSVVHGWNQRAAVLEHHPHRRVTSRRITELGELRLDRFAVPRVAAVSFSFENRLG